MMPIDSPSQFWFLCTSDDILEGKYREFRLDVGASDPDLGPIDLIVTRHQGVPRVWFNVCPHQGRSLNIAPDRFLTDEHNHLMCCVHGAVFEPNEGRCISGPCVNAYLKPLEAREQDGSIEVAYSA